VAWQDPDFFMPGHYAQKLKPKDDSSPGEKALPGAICHHDRDNACTPVVAVTAGVMRVIAWIIPGQGTARSRAR
jgi:hypothetical protein